MGGECGAVLSAALGMNGEGDVGGDLILRMLPILLFGRGGGGRPGMGCSDLDTSPDDRVAGSGAAGRSVELRVSSSYSRAARKFGEMSMGLETERVRSWVSS